MRYLYSIKRVSRPYHHDAAAVGILALSTLGFFWRVFFEKDVWIPAGGGDLVSFLYPVYAFAADSLKQGILPLWNPYLYAGAPFAADIQTGLFYPVNLVVFLAFPQVTYQTMMGLAIFHFFMAGVAMYFCLRFIKAGGRQVGVSGALVGSVAYMFSDVFIVHQGNLNMIAVAAWLPIVFVLFHRGLTDLSLAKSSLAGMALGIALLAGHIQPFLYILLCLGLYFLFEVILGWQKLGGPKLLTGQLKVFSVFMLATLGVGAIQLIPSFEMSQFTVRSAIDYKTSTQYSLSPAQLVSLFVPNFFGRGPSGYWGPWDRTEMGYVGVLTLLAGLVAVVLRRQRVTYFFLALAAISLALSLGGYTFLQGWLYTLGAGFDKVRAPARFLFLLDFALAVLAGLGIDRLLLRLDRGETKSLRGITRFSTLLTVAVTLLTLAPFLYLLSSSSPGPTMTRLIGISEGVALFILLLSASVALLWGRLQSWIRADLIGGLAVILILFDLLTTGSNVEIEKKDPTANFQHPGVISFLKQDNTLFRIDSVTNVWDVWQPDASVLNGIFDVSGVYNPMLLADLDRYWSQLGGRSSSRYDLLNAKYLIGHKNVPLDWEKFELAYDGDPQVNVYRNRKVLPRAFVVYNAEVVRTKDEGFEGIHNKDFDPKRKVIVEGGQALSSPNAASEAIIEKYGLNEITIKASAAADGYLVLSEVYYDGWKARVDGRDEKVLRADFLFRAVPLREGEHEVRLIFEPQSFKIGAIATALTCVVLVTWAAIGLLRRR